MIRHRPLPPLRLPFWKQEGKQFYAEARDLASAVERSGLRPEELQSRMGYGYAALLALQGGARVDGWTAYFVEAMLEPEDPHRKQRPSHST